MGCPRVIPVLLLHQGGLVKTVRFAQPRYIGDPINTVRIFNEKEVDELLILDIDATREKRPPHFHLIEEIVGEAFMPIGYGGGVKSLEQMYRLFRGGVEKVSLSSAAIENPKLVSEAAKAFGNQAVVVTLDIQKKAGWRGSKYIVVTHNATREVHSDPVALAMQMQEAGAGEILLNFVDRDGTMQGYDIHYVHKISSTLHVPVIALGGAGSLEDIRRVVVEGGAAAAAAGSLFVYYGKHRAVLINYPEQQQLTKLWQKESLCKEKVD